MITIDELMTSNPITLNGEDSIEDARAIMTEKDIRHIPVTDNNKLIGLVSQRDILKATLPGTTDGTTISLADIMIRDVSVIRKSDSVRQAAIFLQSHKYGCLPVVSDDQLVGIITDSDFISIAINLLEQVEIAEDTPDMDPDIMDDIDMPVIDDDF